MDNNKEAEDQFEIEAQKRYPVNEITQDIYVGSKKTFKHGARFGYSLRSEADRKEIEHLQSELSRVKEQNGWISVKEKLPEFTTWVLCYCSKGSNWLAFRDTGGWFISTHYGQLYVNDTDTLKSIEVTNWQPLPNPPNVALTPESDKPETEEDQEKLWEEFWIFYEGIHNSPLLVSREIPKRFTIHRKQEKP